MTSIPFFDLSRQHDALSEQLKDAWERVLEKNWFILGEEVKQFEASFAAYLGVDHCISCGNGTDALELALEAGGIGHGDEVIVPANTWVSVAEAVLRRGAAPVFADSLAAAYTIAPESVIRCLTPKTKAIIVVHQYGNPARMDELTSIAKTHRLLLIEDCAHAHGAEYHGKKIGSLGDFGCFSFYPTKNLGCLGDGGAVVTNSYKKSEQIRLIANHGQLGRNIHEKAGRNSRLDEVQAAFLNVKLPYLDRWNQRRRDIAATYKSGLGRVATILPAHANHAPSVFHQFVVLVANRDAVADHLRKRGIGTAVHYPSLISDMAPYAHFRNDPAGLTISEKEKIGLLSLPVFPELTNEEVAYVVRNFNEAVTEATCVAAP